MSQPIRGQGGHLDFPIGSKNTNLVEGVEILLPVKFRWIPFSGFREEVENVSANQRPGRPSCISDRPEKHKLWTGRWDLPSCQVLLNSVNRFQRKSRKCLSQSEALAAILFFRAAQWHKLGRRRWDLASCQVSLNSVQPFERRSRKCLSQSEARAAILFFLSARKTQTWKRALRSCFLSSFVEFCSAVSEEKSKMSQPIRGQGGHLVFPIGSKNTNLVEGVEILLSIRFCWIPFCGFRGEVENVKVYAGRTEDRRRTRDSALWQKLTRAFGSGEPKTTKSVEISWKHTKLTMFKTTSIVLSAWLHNYTKTSTLLSICFHIIVMHSVKHYDHF